MRREGRLTGYLRGRHSSRTEKEQFEQHLQDLGFSGPFNLLDTHPRIKLMNRPSNHSKDSSRCKRKACRGCHAAPASKSLSKVKGIRNKLYSPKMYRARRARKPYLPIDLSFLDLLEYDVYYLAFDHYYDDDEDNFTYHGENEDNFAV